MHFFVTFSFFVWWFWYGFSQFWFRHFKEKSKRKRKLTQKFGAMAPYTPNLSVIYTIENGYSRFNNFVLWNNQSALQNEYFVTYTVKKLLKSVRIKETRTVFYIVNPLTVAKKQSQKTKIYLGFVRHAIFLVYKVRIKFDHWRTTKDFVDNKCFSL